MLDLSLHLMDIIQNSLKAGATRIDVCVAAEPADDCLTMTVRDNGCGMARSLLERAVDPFTTTRQTRTVGLGLPLLRDQCELTGGCLTLASEPGAGTTVQAVLGLSSIDRLPIGSISETMTLLVLADPAVDYRVTLRSPAGTMVLDWADLRGQLGDVPLNAPEVIEWLSSYLDEQHMHIFGGVLHEIIS